MANDLHNKNLLWNQEVTSVKMVKTSEGGQDCMSCDANDDN